MTRMSRDVGLTRRNGNQVIVKGDGLVQPLPRLIQTVDAVSDTQTISTILLHSSVCGQFERIKFKCSRVKKSTKRSRLRSRNGTSSRPRGQGKSNEFEREREREREQESVRER